MGDVATLLFVHFNFIIQFRNIFLFQKSIHMMRYFFKDMHYNTMIGTFCILKKMTFSAFHYLTLSVRCEKLDAHIN